MDAVSPATQGRTRERHKPYPGAEHQMACPNAECLSPDYLELRYQATVWTPAFVTAIDGITFPDIEPDYDNETVSTQEAERTVIGWRCTECDMAYTGPDPLDRLLRLP